MDVMMNYRKSERVIPPMEELPLIKVDLYCGDDVEGIWARQGEDYIVLQNTAVAFYPFPSWGAIFPSTNPPGDRREKIQVGDMKPSEGMELHPDAWDQYLENGKINAEGNLLDEDGDVVVICQTEEASP